MDAPHETNAASTHDMRYTARHRPYFMRRAQHFQGLAHILSSPPLLWAEIQIEKDRTGDTGQIPDTGQTPDTDELKFDKNAIQKIMKYH